MGKRIHDLTLRQLKTLDCGSKTLPDLPRQQSVPGERIPTLQEVFELADECSLRAVYGDPSVRSPWKAHLDWWRVRDLGVLTRQLGASGPVPAR